MTADTILPLADWHVGSELGLLHPDTPGVKLNSWQKYLYKCYMHMLDCLPERIDTVVMMDEMMDGPASRNHKYATIITSPRKQREAVQILLEPLLERCDEKWALIGSEWHVAEWGEATHALAEKLDAMKWGKKPKKGQKDERPRAGHNLFLKIGNIVVDLAHHRSAVMVNRGMPLEREMRYRRIDNPLPDKLKGKAEIKCIVRAHSHTFNVSHDRHGYAMGVPGWQGVYYGYGIAKQSVARIWPDVGWVLIEVDPEARNPVSYDYCIYSYPKAEVYDVREERWISPSQSRTLR